MTPLPNDIARCAGIGSDAEGWLDDCEACARHHAESTGAVTAWMLPPAIIVFSCEYQIPKADT